MAAEDELVIPEVPEAKPDDPEDVSWALSTAEAMWARGDHAEGIKWVRKAAEAASEAEDDMRALQLAKTAADLASMLARRSLADPDAGSPPAEGSAPSAQPSTARSAQQQPPQAAPQQRGKSAPPLPSKASQPPPPPPAKPPVPGSVAPPRAPAAGSVAPPRAFAGPAGAKAQGPAQGKGVLSNRIAPAADSKRGKRRSRENMDAEAQAAGLVPAAAPSDTAEVPAVQVAAAIDMRGTVTRARRGSRPKLDGDATVVAHVSELVAQRPARDDGEPAGQAPEDKRSVAEWDASPTQDLTGPELDHMDRVREEDNRETHVGNVPIIFPSPRDLPAPRPPTPTLHDPEIQTSQAVRVVVWRDANGVHVAPAGTVVSSITIDAVLVVLEPSADLTAWLSHKDK